MLARNRPVLEVRPLALEGVCEISPLRRGDARGFLSEVWSERAMAAAGLSFAFVQENHSYSAARGVLRGLHFQKEPAAQDKLIRVVRGSIFDVAVDIRRASPTFGKWIGIIVSAQAWNQILIPRGLAHGFVTLEAETEVQYKLSAPYRPDLAGAIRFDDPDIAIDWPVPPQQLQLSESDRSAPLLAAIDPGF